MRFDRLVLLAITLLLGCGSDPPGAGTEGNPCASFPAAPCQEGLRCVDGDTCKACGEPGEICCNNNQGDYCTAPGRACDNNIDSDGICTDACGSIGKPCCKDATEPCPLGGQCDSDECTANTSTSCYSGAFPHEFHWINELCGEYHETFSTDTVQEAEACRADLIAQLDAVGKFEYGALDEIPVYLDDVCMLSNFGNEQKYLSYFTSQWLAVCESNWCLTGCTWIDGTCP